MGYTGSLQWKKMTKYAKKAYACFCVQKSSGSKIEYSQSDFMEWYIDERKKIKSGLAIVRKINPSLPYAFNNIKMMNNNRVPWSDGAQRKDSPEWLKRAHYSYHNMISRCRYKQTKSYKYYGAKGIKCLIYWEDFKQWYFDNLNGRQPKGLAVGRIDHSKDYILSNIELTTRSENSKERCRRLGPPVHRGKNAIR